MLHEAVKIAHMLTGTAMVSVGAAIAFSLIKRRPQYPWISGILALFFVCSGISRILISMSWNLVQPLITYIDLLAGLTATCAAFVIWPIALKATKLPSYKDVVELNRKLLSMRELFESFMDRIPVVTYIRDREARLRFVNKAWEKEAGVSRNEVLGKPYYGNLSSADVEHFRKQELGLLDTGASTEYILSSPFLTSQNKSWFVLKFPVHADSENMIGVVALDITDELAREKNSAELAAIVESSEDAIIGTDLHCLVTSWNKGATQLFGFSENEAIGQLLTLFISKCPRFENALNRLKHAEKVVDHDVEGQYRDGSPLSLALSMSPIKSNDGEFVGIAVIARDIKYWKEAQQRIEELNEELTKRVVELDESNKALQQARDDAVAASSLKSAFVANISHELRTPLTGIIGMNELLLDTDLTAEQRSMVKIVHESAHVLLAVVNDILDLAKIEAGKISLEHTSFSPAEAVEECARLLAPAARSKQLQIAVLVDPEIPRTLYGDVSRIKQVLLNLIGNAIKFTDRGTITVRARLEHQDEDKATVVFSVNDTGIGIGKEEQKYLFMPFSQVDNSSTRRHGGTGLGLTISKSLIEMMGGAVGFSSEKNQGSEFWFRVPLDKQPVGDKPPSYLRKSSVTPMELALVRNRKVLVVEDSKVLVELAIRQLAILGVEAQAVTTGREAVDCALTGSYDVVLMDVNLPDITGNEATTMIRAAEFNTGRKRIPIIAMTAGAMTGDRERAIQAGMDDFLSKPVAMEELKAALERVFYKSYLEENPKASFIAPPPGFAGNTPAPGSAADRTHPPFH